MWLQLNEIPKIQIDKLKKQACPYCGGTIHEARTRNGIMEYCFNKDCEWHIHPQNEICTQKGFRVP